MSADLGRVLYIVSLVIVILLGHSMGSRVAALHRDAGRSVALISM